MPCNGNCLTVINWFGFDGSHTLLLIYWCLFMFACIFERRENAGYGYAHAKAHQGIASNKEMESHYNYNYIFILIQLHLSKALFRAIQCEDVDAIATLIKQGADINAKLIDDCWNTPLHKAAEDNRLHSVVILLKNGADITQFNIFISQIIFIFICFLLYCENTSGETPLLTAIRKGHLQCTEILLSCGSPINGNILFILLLLFSLLLFLSFYNNLIHFKYVYVI